MSNEKKTQEEYDKRKEKCERIDGYIDECL